MEWGGGGLLSVVRVKAGQGVGRRRVGEERWVRCAGRRKFLGGVGCGVIGWSEIVVKWVWV